MLVMGSALALELARASTMWGPRIPMDRNKSRCTELRRDNKAKRTVVALVIDFTTNTTIGEIDGCFVNVSRE